MTRLPSRMFWLSGLFLCLFSTQAFAAEDWTILQVPGVWDEQSNGEFANYDGIAWYRCFVQVPANWKGARLTLTTQSIDNAYEAYFNGVKIGSEGTFPPKYTSGLNAVAKKWAVAADNVHPGAFNVVAIRVYDHDGRGGFKGAAPMLSKDVEAVELKGSWQFRTGDDLAWSKLPEAIPSAARFGKVEDAAGIAARNFKAPDDVKPLAVEVAQQRFQIAEGLEWTPVLTEPEIAQPVHMSFDERGRMWVIEYRQYPDPAGLTVVSRDTFWRVVYDKVPPAPPNHDRGRDRISIHEDTDGDGTYDSHKVFLDGMNIVTSCARGRGGVWVLNPPYLLFYADRNNDDVPDGDPEVHLSGFGLEDTHSCASNLMWGPDGWLYAAQGSTVSGHIMRPGDKTAVHSMGQLIWRYHPERKTYEIFAEGGGNAWGLEIDSKGRVFSGHNGGDTRGFHYVQGGYSQKGFGKHGPLSNPYSFGYFPPMKHPSVPRFTHAFVIYEGASLPETHWGKLFGVAPLQGHVVESDFFPDGTTFQTKDIGHPVTTTDSWFRPVNIKVGPDGAIYVADMYEGQIAHLRHHEGIIDNSNGRIYRLQKKGAKPEAPFNLGKKSSKELVATLEHPNKWYRETALRLLGDRRDSSLVPGLVQRLGEAKGQTALELLWAIHLSGGFNEDVARQALAHSDPFVRSWTIRFLGDQHKVADETANRMVDGALHEKDAAVRSQYASTSKRLPAAVGLRIARQLVTHDEDVNDPHIPLLIWWGIESHCADHRDDVVKMFDDSVIWRLPMVQQHLLKRVMQRFAATGSRADLLACAKLLTYAPDKPSAEKLMAGFEEAFKGRPLAGLPTELFEALAKSGVASPALALRQGKAEALEHALSVIRDEKADKGRRIEFIQILGEVRQPKCVATLLETLDKTQDDAVRMAILTALQAYDLPEVGQRVIAAYPKLSPDALAAAQTMLASRKGWALQLLEAVDAGAIDKASLPAVLVRKLTIHRDDRIRQLVAKNWGQIEGETSEQMQQQFAKLQGVLQQGTGNPYNGKKLFTATCAKCHRLFTEGGQIGPDLTAYKRDDVANILLNVVNPSAEIREGFENYLAVTADGRTVNGFLVDKDKQVLVLRGVDGQNITLAQDQVEELLPQKVSLMPAGLLSNLTDQQVRDLFAYLRSSQPLNEQP